MVSITCRAASRRSIHSDYYNLRDFTNSQRCLIWGCLAVLWPEQYGICNSWGRFMFSKTKTCMQTYTFKVLCITNQFGLFCWRQDQRVVRTIWTWRHQGKSFFWKIFYLEMFGCVQGKVICSSPFQWYVLCLHPNLINQWMEFKKKWITPYTENKKLVTLSHLGSKN